MYIIFNAKAVEALRKVSADCGLQTGGEGSGRIECNAAEYAYTIRQQSRSVNSLQLRPRFVRAIVLLATRRHLLTPVGCVMFSRCLDDQ